MTSGGKKDPTYVEDVFSTTLYKGTGSSGLNVTNGIKLGNANAGNSVNFDGTGDYLLTNSSSDYTFGTGDFTVEHWIYTDFTYTGNAAQIIDGRDFGAIGDSNWATSITSSNEYRFFAVTPGAGGANRITNNTTLSANAWHHIALVRSSGTTKMYIDGVQQSQTFTDANNYNNTTLTFGIHGPNRSSFPFNGNLSDVRITKGQALYTSNFTPSTKSLTTTSQGATASNVKLLCCNTNILTASPGTITSGGNVSAQGFGRFTGIGGEGGMVWAKSRSNADSYWIVDTVRGLDKSIKSNSNAANNTASGQISSFNNGSFTLGNNNQGQNYSGFNYSSWTFRKQKGFFDIVTYTGDGASSKTISHSLGSIPGVIMVKRTDAVGNWVVYHTRLGNDKILYLDTSDSAPTNMDQFDKTDPTASTFTVEHTGSGGNDINVNNATYVAYLFAGGASTDSTARSVEFDESSTEYLSVPTSTDFDFGSGDFTIECWCKGKPTGDATFVNISNGNAASNSAWILYLYQGKLWFGITENTGWDHSVQGTTLIQDKQWHHIAATREGNTFKIWVDGLEEGSFTYSGSIPTSTRNLEIGTQNGSYLYDGHISNVRVVKGTALYTTSFRAPTKPLAAITNTKLLCCNNSSITGATVTPGTITENGTPTASTDSPFDDLSGYKFGEEGDQNIIKCGSYVGDSAANHEIYVGWEPQWWLVKNITDNSSNWQLLDSMRGWISDGNDQYFAPNNNSAESAFNFGNPTPRGFNLSNASSNWQNELGKTYIYIAIRRPDSLVAKPAEVGTDVFSMVMSTASATIPAFYSGFPVDFSMAKQPAATTTWYQQARLLGLNHLVSSSTAAQSGMSWGPWDSNVGWGISFNVYHQSWMWKRGAGFDVVTYRGTGANRLQAHGLGRVPEMVTCKKRSSTQNWYTYHFGLNGGTNPQLKTVMWNSADAQDNTAFTFNNTAPTSTVFSLGSDDACNGNGDTYIALLFASVEGISKLGYYDGSNSEQTITTGFQPRFVIIKCSTAAEGWVVLDTLRGWGAGDDKALRLDINSAQGTDPYGAPTSTGFTLVGNWNIVNQSGKKYIYYAHA